MDLHKNIKLIAVFNIINCLDFYVPIKLIYLQQVTGSYAIAASVISFVWIFSALFEIPTGVFSDFLGRRKTMMLGALFATVAYTLFAVGNQFGILAIGALFEGASRALFNGNNDAYLHDSLAESENQHQYDHYYGRINSYLTVSSFLAALLSGFIAHISFHLLMWLSVIPQLLSFFLTFSMKDIPRKKIPANIFSHLREALREVKNNLNLRYLSFTKIFGGAGEAAYEFQITVVNAVWPIWAIGIFRALQEVGGIPGYYFAGTVIKKIGATNILFAQTVVSWLGNVVASFAQSFVSPLIISTSLIFYGPSDTASSSLLQKEFTDQQRATIASLNSFGRALYFSVVAYVSGLVATYYSPFFALITTQIFFLPVIYFQFLLFRNLRKK